ncbi:MAG: type I methionyl aminopeptidase [Spirochaetes bacterium]|nr:type I methionyl aminopeptidase [Spirochaetota bacterium]
MGIYIYREEQIEKIFRACQIAVGVLKVLEPYICEGISTFELDKIASEFIAAQNAKAAFLGYRGYPATLCTSINDVVVHGIPSKKVKLRRGDIVGIDVGVYCDGYYGDVARTYKVGNVSRQAETLLRATEEALMKGIEQVVIGNRISDISHAIEVHAAMYGFSAVREFVGHGIGLSLHEEPSIPNFGEPGMGPRIAEGMVFAIEPMVNAGSFEVRILKDGWTAVTADGSLSAHFEHTVAVMNGKAKILTAIE